jgi:hypothetical protein
MDFQDIARAKLEDFSRYTERHIVEGEALRIEAESKHAKNVRHHLYVHMPSFTRRNTMA